MSPYVLRLIVVVVFVAAAALAAPAAAREVPFTTVQPLAGSFVGARALELADLDRDGDLDAVVGAGTDGLAWWENAAGDGSTWTERALDATFAGAFALAVGDLDADGWPDVAAVSRSAGDVAWWENDGTPATGAWTRLSIDTAFAQANAVRLADLDGNGTLDVVASGEAADAVAWWENDGSPLDDTTDLGGGDFWVERTIAALDAPVALAVGDLDGDGVLDVAAARAAALDPEIAWARNDGTPADGGWTFRTVDDVFVDPRTLELADLDGDGDLDLLAGSDGVGDRVTWWESDGTPLDDTTDLGNGNRWPQHDIASGVDGVTSLQAADLDGDGDLDALAAAATADDLEWWENEGDPTAVPWPVHTLDDAFDGGRDARAGDLDGDGDPDVAAASFGADEASWWENRTLHRSALLDDVVALGAGDEPDGLALADLDGDGDVDVASGQGTALGNLSWWENDGSPAVAGWSEHLVGDPFSPPQALAAGDLDGDGDADLVAGQPVSSVPFSWWENDGTPGVGAWTEHTLRAAADSIRAIELADLDRDGDPDVVFAEGFGDRVGWFENDGTACAPTCTWPEHALDAAFALPSFLAVADLDGDGDLDVASQSGNDQLLVWWENDGTPADDLAWTEHGIDSGSSALCPVVAADFDGDGDTDVGSCPGTESSFRWFANDGTPADDTAWAAQGAIVPAPIAPNEVAAADLDGDGDVDLAVGVGLTASLEELFLAWWENVGAGSAWTRHDVAAPVDVQRLRVADLDRDGRPDFAGTDLLGDAIAWWPNGGGQLRFATTDRSSGGLLEGAEDDVLAIAATHLGRAGDSAAELVTFELSFEAAPDDPLSTAEANALIDRIEIVLDDGDGVLDAGDATVTTLLTLGLAGGVESVPLPSGEAVQLDAGEAKTYLVVVTAKAGGAAATPNSFRVTHLTASSSTARDLAGDVPLANERAADVSTGAIAVQAGCHFLGLSHTGGGSPPAPAPDRSAGCDLGDYVPGELVTLTATPDPGWFVSLWQGTDDDLGLATTNTVTMPAADHAASVHYAFPDHLTIDGDFLSGSQEREACLTIAAGDVDGSGDETTVAAGAEVVFRAAESVAFHDGFVVRGFASFRVEIATPAECGGP